MTVASLAPAMQTQAVPRPPSFSLVLEHPPADPAAAHRHFAAKLGVETDPSDVWVDLQKGVQGFAVVDCRSKESYARGHVPGALSVPYRTIGPDLVARIPKDRLVVAYCAGTYCNASTKGALRLAALGYQVKEMIGGLDGWKAEGYPVETGPGA